MAEPIINKVEESGLISLDLEKYYPAGPIMIFDVKDHLFMGLILKEKDFMPTLYVVGQSETTIRVANTFTDYLIINHSMLNHDSMSKLTNVKPLLSIDPLIIDNPEDADKVEYHDYRYSKNNHHSIKGTHEEVIAQIRRISEEFEVNEFIVHTDQKDLSRIFKVIRELS